MTIIAGSFLVIFVLVLALGYVLLLRHDNAEASPPPRSGPPGAGVRVLLAIAFLAVVVGVTWAVIAGALQVLAWLEKPVLDPIFNVLARLFLHPVGAEVLAGVVLVIGLRLAPRFRRPDRFRTGVGLIALALATFWPFQYAVSRFDLPFWEYEAFLHGIAFFVSACLFTGGFESIRRATNTPRDDSWEFLN
jgi:hypothetical protein